MSSSYVSQPQVNSAAIRAVGPRATDADREGNVNLIQRIRDVVAGTFQSYEVSHPKALNLYAAVLGALALRLRRVATSLRGSVIREHWLAALRGERSMRLVDFCRLATSNRPEALAAFDDGLDVMAAARGRVVVSLDSKIADFGKALEDTAEGNGKLLKMGIRAHADGKLDATEIAALRQQIRAEQENLVQLQVALYQAERMPEKGGAK